MHSDVWGSVFLQTLFHIKHPIEVSREIQLKENVEEEETTEQQEEELPTRNNGQDTQSS